MFLGHATCMLFVGRAPTMSVSAENYMTRVSERGCETLFYSTRSHFFNSMTSLLGLNTLDSATAAACSNLLNGRAGNCTTQGVFNNSAAGHRGCTVHVNINSALGVVPGYGYGGGYGVVAPGYGGGYGAVLPGYGSPYGAVGGYGAIAGYGSPYGAVGGYGAIAGYGGAYGGYGTIAGYGGAYGGYGAAAGYGAVGPGYSYGGVVPGGCGC